MHAGQSRRPVRLESGIHDRDSVVRGRDHVADHRLHLGTHHAIQPGVNRLATRPDPRALAQIVAPAVGDVAGVHVGIHIQHGGARLPSHQGDPLGKLRRGGDVMAEMRRLALAGSI